MRLATMPFGVGTIARRMCWTLRGGGRYAGARKSELTPHDRHVAQADIAAGNEFRTACDRSHVAPAARRPHGAGALGCRRPAAAGPGDRHAARPGRAQCDRHPCRRLCAVSGACDRRRPACAGPPARPHRYRAGRSHRPVPAMGATRADRLARSVGPHVGEVFADRLARRLGHPPDHRGDPGAHQHAGDRRRRCAPGGWRPTVRC